MNLVKHGDRSKISNLNKLTAFLGSNSSIIKFIISFKYDNLTFIEGFIIL